MFRSLSLALLSALPCHALAQGGVAPERAADHWGWKNRDYPLGRSWCRLQVRIDAQMLPKTLTPQKLIRGIGLRRAFGRSIYRPSVLTTEVWMGNTSDTNSSITTNFATNKSRATGGQIAFQKANIALPPASFGSPRDFLMFPISRPFVFLGPHLLIEWSNTDTRQRATGWRVDYVGSIGGGGVRGYFGLPCAKAGPTSVGSTGGTGDYTPGSTLNFWSGAGPASVPAIHALGFSATAFGALPLPLDLTAAGAKDCKLYTSLDLLSVTTRNANGVARNNFLVPNNPSLRQLRFYTQWINLDTNANAFGLSFTEATAITIGPISGISSYRLVSTANNTSALGTKFNNEMPVTRLLY